jgi:hypothetical protein
VPHRTTSLNSTPPLLVSWTEPLSSGSTRDLEVAHSAGQAHQTEGQAGYRVPDAREYSLVQCHQRVALYALFQVCRGELDYVYAVDVRTQLLIAYGPGDAAPARCVEVEAEAVQLRRWQDRDAGRRASRIGGTNDCGRAEIGPKGDEEIEEMEGAVSMTMAATRCPPKPRGGTGRMIR